MAHRNKMFDELLEAQEKRYAAMPRKPISVTLPDGAVKEGTSWETTPLDIAKSISSGLANVVVGAKVNGVVWDLTRRLEGDCSLSLLKFDDKDGKEIYWHSSAHILGECMERFGPNQRSTLTCFKIDTSEVRCVTVQISKTDFITTCGWETIPCPPMPTCPRSKNCINR